MIGIRVLLSDGSWLLRKPKYDGQHKQYRLW